MDASQDRPDSSHSSASSPLHALRVKLANLRPIILTPITSDSTIEKYEVALKALRSGNLAAAAASLNSLSTALKDQGDVDLALALLEDSLSLKISEHGPVHLLVSTAMCNLAVALSDAGRFDEAHQMFTDALAMIEAVAGTREHLQMALALTHYGTSLMNENRNLLLTSACLAEALEIRRKLLPADSAGVAASMFQLAHCLKLQGDADKAVDLGKQALHIYSTALGPDHPLTTQARRESVLVLKSQSPSSPQKSTSPFRSSWKKLLSLRPGAN